MRLRIRNWRCGRSRAIRVVFHPCTPMTLRPMRLVFGPPGVDSIVGSGRHFTCLHHCSIRIRLTERGVERQSVELANAA